MGPSGNGLVGADERGRNPAESRGYRMGAPVRFQKAVSRSKEKRRSGALRGERPASLGVRRKAQLPTVASFGAPLPSPLVRGLPSSARGMEIPALPAPYANRGGGALIFFRAGCLRCESDIAHESAQRVLAERTRGSSQLLQQHEYLDVELVLRRRHRIGLVFFDEGAQRLELLLIEIFRDGVVDGVFHLVEGAFVGEPERLPDRRLANRDVALGRVFR